MIDNAVIQLQDAISKLQSGSVSANTQEVISSAQSLVKDAAAVRDVREMSNEYLFVI